MSCRYLIGDVHETLATLEPGTVDLIVSSPPFLALRSYLPADHPDKPKEIGSEATPGHYLDILLDVVEACDRVLAPHGSLVFELGDTYAGSGGAGGDYQPGGLRDGQAKFDGSASKWDRSSGRRAPGGQPYTDMFKGGGPGGKGWPLDKSKVCIPQAFALSLSYGRNILATGLSAVELVDWADALHTNNPDIDIAGMLAAMRAFIARTPHATVRETEPWRVRNTVAWCRPNPPVGRDADKYRPATSYLTVATKARDRYWDGDAVRTAGSANTHARLAQGVESRPTTGKKAENPNNNHGSMLEIETAGAPLLDYWQIPTAPYKGSHYATYPPDLIVPIIRAMCPQRVCRTCGQPSRRIVGETTYRTDDAHRSHVEHFTEGERVAAGVNNFAAAGGNKGCVAERETVGWTDCHHDNWRPGHVLDPFAGTGVTGLVATGHGHDCTLIDLDSRNAELALERVGPMLLTVEGTT